MSDGWKIVVGHVVAITAALHICWGLTMLITSPAGLAYMAWTVSLYLPLGAVVAFLSFAIIAALAAGVSILIYLGVCRLLRVSP